jgi:sulfite reductase (NADPH) flavoprotein alpha-component
MPFLPCTKINILKQIYVCYMPMRLNKKIMTLTENKTLPIGIDTNALQQISVGLTEQQLIWLSGYFFGASQSRVEGRGLGMDTPSVSKPSNGTYAPQVQTTSQPQMTVQPSKVTILYGSQSGNSKKAATLAAESLKAAGSEVVVADMSDYKTAQLKNEKLLLCIVATYGEGEPPAAAEELHKFIFSSRAPKLPDTQFAVLALGDKSYVQYCQTGKDFDQQLEKLGAKRITERIDCDVDWHDDAERWIKNAVEVVSRQSSVGSNGNGVHQASIKNGLSPTASSLSPKYDRKKPFESEILEKIQLNGRDSVKETWHVELSLADSGIQYQAGDVLHIIPTNSERIVSDVLKASQLDPSVKVDFEGQNQELGHVLLEKSELTVLNRDVLQKYYDLSKNDTLKAILDDPKALQNYIYGRDIADLITDFPADLNPQVLASMLRKLPSRAYSIASSILAHEEEVHLTVGAVRYQAQGRKKEGVASSFLADRVAVGEKVKIFIEENEYFKLPKDPSANTIMVGPGTGIAPFRAFVEEREAQGANGRNWLFFGNPNFTTDFLYQTEWQGYLKSGALNRLDLAFSRDQEQKVYVQHKLLQKSKEVFDWIQNGAYFYVCGDKNRMAKDVEQALIQIAKKEGGYSDEKAMDCVKDLKKQRRYLEDVY